jgi:hypothetical protein
MTQRQNKINTVMKEYKSGTLKSGGSGKKVTNPKQAIAIALSEARNMNQGGMMSHPELYDRPMFQTPEQRAAGGIMGGVAPIRKYAEGDYVSDDFWSLDQTEEDSGMNLRDVTDFFFDPSDPLDVATLPLIAWPPALLAARLTKMGVKANKISEQLAKVAQVQEKVPSLLGRGTGRGATWMQTEVAKELPGLPGEISDLVAPPAMADEPEEEVEVEGEESTPWWKTLGVMGGGIAALHPKTRPLAKAAGKFALDNKKKGIGIAAASALPFVGGDDEAGAPPISQQATGPLGTPLPQPTLPVPSEVALPKTSASAAVNTAITKETETGGDPSPEEEEGFFANIMDRLSDPRVQAGLANAAKDKEGWTKRNFFSDFNEGAREYDVERAQIASLEGDDSTFITNFEYLRDKFPTKEEDEESGKSDEEIMQLTLSLNSRGSSTAKATLFKAMRANINKNSGVSDEALWTRASRMVDANGGTGLNLDESGNILDLTTEQANALGGS